MAKRTPETEVPEAEAVPDVPPTVGERLRAAREKAKLSLEDVAAQTRIPQRHLASIETAEWDNLPAPTYTIGFAKSYAAVVGLDRTEIGDQLREEMGGQRFASTSADVFEPADPRRTMPKSLVVGAVIAAGLLIALMSYLNSRSLEEPEQNTVASAPAAPAPATAPQPAPAAPGTTSGPVVLTATDAAWVQVTDQGKTLFQGQMTPGQTYTVPPTATSPMLKAGKPEALKVTVGNTAVPQVGPAGKVTTVSLKPSDLMKPAGVPTPPAAPQSAPPTQGRVQAKRAPAPAAPPAPVPPPATTAPETNGQ